MSHEVSAPPRRRMGRLPEQAPFSRHYQGAAFGFEWKLIAREKRRLRCDPRRELTIHVAP